MRYHVTIGERTFEVDLHDGRIAIDGDPVEASLASVPGTPIRQLLVDDRAHALTARPGERRGDWSISLGGRTVEAVVVDERRRAIEAMTGASGAEKGARPLRAPMPGLVLKVEVEPGQVVKQGDGLVIVEAMKMENELRAEAAGTVARVLVEEGSAVEKGAVLIEFES